jgi:BolA protein
MNAEEKTIILHERLTKAFQPDLLEIIDDSDKHVGHAGHGGGGRHFTIKISAAGLNDKSRVDAFREIYALFTDLIPDEIHALSIKIINN